MSNPSAIQEWLDVHRQLMALEAEFAALGVDAASGKVARHELEQHRAFLVDARQHCSAAYSRAFRESGSQSVPDAPPTPRTAWAVVTR